MAATKKAGTSDFDRNVIVFILGVLFSGAISVRLGQCTDYDLLNYHYYNAYSFLNRRLNFDYGLANIQGYFNPLPDIPFYLLESHMKPIWAGLFMGAIHGVSFWIIFAIAYHILSELKPAPRLVLSVSAAITGFLGPFNLSELGASMNDNTVGIFVLLSVLFTLKSMPSADSPASFKKNMVIFSGAVMGLAGGLKLTALTFALGGALSFLVLSAAWKEKIKTCALWAGAAAAGFIAADGYWMFVLWEKFGNPMFPYFNKIFKSPYCKLDDFRDVRFFPHGLQKWLLLPFYFLNGSGGVSEMSFRDMRLALVFVLGAAALLIYLFRRFARKTGQAPIPTALDNNGRYLLGFFFFSFIVWEKMFCIYRYAVPVEVISPIIMVILVFFLFRREKIRMYSLVLLFAAAILFAVPPNWGRGVWWDALFQVSVPRFESKNALVIMPFSPGEAESYLVPFFPKGVRFIRLESWLTNPEDKGSRFQDEMKGVLSSHSGPVYLLTRRTRIDNELLKKYYGLAISDPHKLMVSGNSGDYGLFRVSRF
jgi:hypothetical protein